ncbi:Uncharacterised protein [BD1-7 clade bacterium]|uniref:Uncharacterized protein n=1 Tax=BD1-7 clade bacterium TaxID=2029982 RepID=A0A5S9Q5X4_9GAMM|nr:Uncharacterised protein [BD1-7 clade bacterium]
MFLLVSIPYNLPRLMPFIADSDVFARAFDRIVNDELVVRSHFQISI